MLSRRALICGLLSCLPLLGVKSLKKKYIKFNRAKGCCFSDIIYDYEYELVDMNASYSYKIDTERTISSNYKIIPVAYDIEFNYYMFTVTYNNKEILIETPFNNFEILEK